MWHRVVWYKFTSILEKHAASILRAQELAKEADSTVSLLG
jgi:hypothetical protein